MTDKNPLSMSMTSSTSQMMDPNALEENERIRQYMQNPDIPADAKAIARILKTARISDYDPKIINQLLDFMYRFLTDVLIDADDLRTHAAGSSGHKKLDLDDVKLALQIRSALTFAIPPSRQALIEMAKNKNGQPIPAPPSEREGCVILPSEEHRLTVPGFQVHNPTTDSTSMSVD